MCLTIEIIHIINHVIILHSTFYPDACNYYLLHISIK